MSRYIMSAIVALCLLTFPAQAAVKFYYQNSGQWGVSGFLEEGTKYPRCLMGTGWDNGAAIEVHRDLNDGENLMYYYNPKITFKQSDKDQPMFLTFYGSIFPKSGHTNNLEYRTINEHLIVFGGMPDAFYKGMGLARELEFKFTGDIPSILIGMRGSAKAVEYMNECIAIYRKMNDKEDKWKSAPEITPHEPNSNTPDVKMPGKNDI